MHETNPLTEEELTSENILRHYIDPAQLVYATFNGLGMPIGIKLSDEICAQGGEAASLAASQAMNDGHTKAQSMSKSIGNE